MSMVNLFFIPMRKFKLTMYIDASVEDSFEFERIESSNEPESTDQLTGSIVVAGGEDE